MRVLHFCLHCSQLLVCTNKHQTIDPQIERYHHGTGEGGPLAPPPHSPGFQENVLTRLQLKWVFTTPRPPGLPPPPYV
jgi:hypothetical protein